jgi:hypothetical protein
MKFQPGHAPVGRAAINAAKTHCKRGHPFSPRNTHRGVRGERICRMCDAERMGEKRAYRRWVNRLEKQLSETY